MTVRYSSVLFLISTALCLSTPAFGLEETEDGGLSEASTIFMQAQLRAPQFSMHGTLERGRKGLPYSINGTSFKVDQAHTMIVGRLRYGDEAYVKGAIHKDGVKIATEVIIHKKDRSQLGVLKSRGVKSKETPYQIDANTDVLRPQ